MSIELARKIYHMSLSCMENCYVRNEPTPAYADNGARLLCMVWAHESDGGKARRQYGFPSDPHEPRGTKGAFGAWQTELGSIMASLNWIRATQKLSERVRMWTAGSDVRPEWFVEKPNMNTIHGILRLLQMPEGDELSCLLARIHFYRFPEPMPDTDRARADLAKKRYNTYAGKATPGMYLAAYERHFSWLNSLDKEEN